MQASATGTWFQTPEAYEFFESMPELFRPFVVGVASNLPSLQGRGGDRLLLRGVCVGYVTVERNPIKQYFTRRAIIIGGPALADDATDEEVVALLCALKNLPSFQGEELCSIEGPVDVHRMKNGVGSPIYIECRNFNDYSRWKGAFEKAGFEYKKHLNFHVDCTDKEKMWERLSENRKRQIKKGKPNPSPSLKGRDVSEADIREWYAILEELYRTKVKTPLWPVKFFIEAYRQGIGQFMLVRHEGKIIGGSMVVRWKPTPNPSLEGGELSAHNPSHMSGLVRGSNSLPSQEGKAIGRSFASVWGAHTADTTQYSILKENAQANRKNPTEAETILWNLLKGNNLGLHFRRQHIILDYIVDFICLEKGLVIELDGGYHNDPDQAKYDKQRTDHLKQLGYTELRFANEELLTNPDAVIARIKCVASQLPSFQGRAGDRLGAVYEWFECGLNAQYKEQYPSVMATFMGMCYAAEEGIGRYDMMGAGVPDVPYGVRDFKAEFGGQLVEHGRFVCVRKHILYKIGTLAVKMMKGVSSVSMR